MTQIKNIIKMYFEEGKNISQIAKETGHDRKTVRNYLYKENWNKELPKLKKQPSFSKLEPFKADIDSWLNEDKKSRRKQRHTAKRVYDWLVERYKDDFNCSYRTVAAYVAMKKKELFSEKNGFLPLEHVPGEAQVDFGDGDFYENGKLYNGKYFNLSFPYSSKGYTQLFKGENQECLFEGLKTIFEHIGGVPPKIWFDNASTIVTKVIKGGGRNLTDDFIRFMEHYGFEAVFCNVNAGHEKGYVLIKLTANNVIILDESYREIVRHARLYGNYKQQSMKWLPYLNQLARRPGALKYTGIYQMLPQPLR